MSRQIDPIVSRIRNNPIVAALILLGTVIIALSTFTDAARNLLELVTPSSTLDVAGPWKTGVLTNPFAERDTYRLTFDFRVRGERLTGSVRQTHSQNRYDSTKPILEGRFQDNTVYFHTMEQSDIYDSGEVETVSYRNIYRGEVTEDTIRFTLQSDRPWGFPPQEFVAKRP